MNAGDSRAKILGSIRQSLKGASHLPPPPQVLLPPPSGPDGDLAKQFARELTQISGQFFTVSAAEVAGWLLGLMQASEARQLVAWSAAQLPVPGLLDALQANGVQLVDSTVPPDEPARSAALARIETVKFGLTGADAAFADTGTVALLTGPGRPRLASLSVSTHVALLDPRRLYPSWAAWLAADRQAAAQRMTDASNLTLVTGPSRTGDIEMTLTVGVHGPREMIVALVC